MKTRWISIASVLLALASGCQCCPLFDHYANVVDDVNDTHLYFDRCYNPRFDITRMGKPDWCSPLNRMLCKRCCNNGCYDRYDDCNLYPPLTPQEFPSNVMPPPTIRTKRIQRRLDTDLMDEMMQHTGPAGRTPDEATAPDPVPAPAPMP